MEHVGSLTSPPNAECNSSFVPHTPMGVVDGVSVQLLFCSLHTRCDTTSCIYLHTKWIHLPPAWDKRERGKSGSDYLQYTET